MRPMVIGGAGFIGAYVVRALMAKGHEPVVHDMAMSDNTLQRLLSDDELAGLTLVRGDVTDLAQTVRAIRTHGVDSLIHLAAWQIPASNENPTKAIEVNGVGFNNTLEAMASLGLQRLVWMSSNAVFGSPEFQENPVPNDAFHHPNTVYGALKSLNEYMAEHYFQQRGVDSIGFRLCLVYGYGRLRGASTFASDMIVQAALGSTCDVDTGDADVDWYYVEDVAALIADSLTVPSPPRRVYNTHSDMLTVRKAAAFLMDILPEAKLNVKPGSIPANWNLDASLLEKELGFTPRFSAKEGLMTTAAVVRQRRGLPPLPGVEIIDHYDLRV
jgi:UDP-glucose 4-epimerase